tara:strand:- start:8734 stop:9210 length:477 start_codon:yes stop_codon:yes gene_type:complete
MDDDWINKINEEDNLYNDFYYEKNRNIWIYYLYVNLNNEIGHVKKENHILDDTKVSKERLLFLLRINSIFKNSKHSLLSIHKYNIDLKPDNVLEYLKEPQYFSFMDKINIKDLIWKDSISLFQDLNCLYVIYKERKSTSPCTKKMCKIRKRKNKTKKN